MTEIEINNGQNIIDIIFDDFASCLVIKKACAVNWPDCGGSVGEYYAIANYAVDERNSYTNTMNNALSEGSDIEQIEAIKVFLNLFSNGKYSIYKFTTKIDEVNFLASNQVTYAKDIPQSERFSGWFFPFWDSNEPIIYSITNDRIDPIRVEYYCELIRKGLSPTVLTFEVSDILSSNYSRSYVLDGHHKIQAYLKLKENIPIIKIMKSEECSNKTSSLLHSSKSILNDFEFKHLFENSGENLLTIDFLNDKDLTSYIDELLEKSDRIDISIINIFKKYATSKNQSDIDWLQFRLNILEKNKNIHLMAYGKGLIVYEKRKDERFGECWFSKTLNTRNDLKRWIHETITNLE